MLSWLALLNALRVPRHERVELPGVLNAITICVRKVNWHVEKRRVVPEVVPIMIEDNTLKQLLRINDELMQSGGALIGFVQTANTYSDRFVNFRRGKMSGS